MNEHADVGRKKYECIPTCAEVLDVFKFCVRRALIYPYIRRFDLAEKVVTDVMTILRGGKRAIIRCLLHVHLLFENSDVYYLLNNLYLTSYILYVQIMDDGVLENFIKCVSDAKLASNLTKQMLDLDLLSVEALLLDESEDEAEYDNDSD